MIGLLELGQGNVPERFEQVAAVVLRGPLDRRELGVLKPLPGPATMGSWRRTAVTRAGISGPPGGGTVQLILEVHPNHMGPGPIALGEKRQDGDPLLLRVLRRVPQFGDGLTVRPMMVEKDVEALPVSR